MLTSSSTLHWLPGPPAPFFELREEPPLPLPPSARPLPPLPPERDLPLRSSLPGSSPAATGVAVAAAAPAGSNTSSSDASQVQGLVVHTLAALTARPNHHSYQQAMQLHRGCRCGCHCRTPLLSGVGCMCHTGEQQRHWPRMGHYSRLLAARLPRSVTGCNTLYWPAIPPAHTSTRHKDECTPPVLQPLNPDPCLQPQLPLPLPSPHPHKHACTSSLTCCSCLGPLDNSHELIKGILTTITHQVHMLLP